MQIAQMVLFVPIICGLTTSKQNQLEDAGLKKFVRKAHGPSVTEVSFNSSVLQKTVRQELIGHHIHQNHLIIYICKHSQNLAQLIQTAIEVGMDRPTIQIFIINFAHLSSGIYLKMEPHMEQVPHATATMTQLQFALTEQELHLLLYLTRAMEDTTHSVTTYNIGAYLTYLKES